MEERVRRFAQIIESGSFTGAARKLHTSQPALTTGMQKLERELGVQLLVRNARSLTVTAAGQLAYEYAKQVDSLQKNLLQELAELGKQPVSFRLGCIDSIARLLVDKRLLTALTSVELSLTVQNSTRLLDQLREGELDAALVVEQPLLGGRLHARSLGFEAFTLVCSDRSRQAVEQAVNRGQAIDFLAYNPESATYALLRGQLGAAGVTCKDVLHSTNPEVLLRLAQQGKGVAALPSAFLKDQAVGLAALPGPTALGRRISLVSEVRRKLPAEFTSMTEQLESHLQ